jgi:hypothetical protein
MVHGIRRAAEMDEVAATLAALSMPNDMTRAAAETQRRIGAMKLDTAEGLVAKSGRILKRQKDTA